MLKNSISHYHVVRLGLNEFLDRCVAQLHVYICFATQCHNIYNYLDQIKHETQNFIDCSKVLDQEFYMQNPHFLQNKLNKPNFHKNLNIFFSKYFYTNVGNMLFVDDTPCKIMFNGSYIGIFLDFFMTFMRTTIICWELFSLTWNLFILQIWCFHICTS